MTYWGRMSGGMSVVQSSPITVPPLAALYGYTSLKWNSVFQNTSKIDLANTGNPGFDWYTRWNFPNPPTEAYWNTSGTTNPSLISVSGGLMTLQGLAVDPTFVARDVLWSATYGGSNNLIGNFFGPGGYFEVVWNPHSELSTASMPSFPFVVLQDTAFLASGTSPFVELDLDERFGTGAGTFQFTSNIWDWTISGGTYTGNEATRNYGVTPSGLVTEGLLWVPQAQNGGANGLIANAFNNVHIPAMDLVYSATGGFLQELDSRQVAIYMGAGYNASNVSVPIDVQSFRVWGLP